MHPVDRSSDQTCELDRCHNDRTLTLEPICKMEIRGEERTTEQPAAAFINYGPRP